MIITEKSIPVYNYSYLANAISPGGANSAVFTDAVRKETVWTCADWITFFKALNAKYGEKQAKDIWSYFWNLGTSSGAGGAGDIRAGSGVAYDSVPLDCRTTNADFRAFISKYNLTDVVYKGLGNIAKPLGLGTDVIVDVSSAITTSGKILKYGIPILLLTGGILLVVYGYKKVQHA